MALDPTSGEPRSASPGERQPTPENPYPLDLLGRQIKTHWHRYRPKMCRALEEAGELDKAIYAAQERTHDALSELVEKGWDWNQAWEALRQEWAFLPAEEEEDEENQPQPDPVILIEQIPAKTHSFMRCSKTKRHRPWCEL